MTSVVELLSDDELEGLFLTLKQKNKNAIQKIKRETDRLYPLALSQEKFWYFSQLHKNNVTYNIPVRFTIVGELNLDIFEASIKRQIVQNEVLRTKIVTSNGVPKQKIGSSDTIKIEKLDLKYDQEQIIDEYLIKLASKTFDIPGDYLFRPYIVRLVDNQYIALFVFHHIIFDGWSVSIFLKNLSNDYNSMLMNTDLQEKKSDIQFIDYASWQVEHYNKGNFNLKLEQWKQTLKDKNVKLDLPYISVPNNTQNNFFTGKKLLRQLPNKLFNTIEAAAKLCNTTPYVVSLAAYVILLYKYSQQDIINIGTPVANRINDHVKEVLGCLMNTLVLSFNVETKKTLKDIIVNTKQIVTHALENQDIPIETIIKHSNPDRESHDHPYFQTLFVFQNATNVDVNISDCDAKVSLLDLGTAKLDLTFQLMKIAGSYELEVEYRDELFSEAIVLSFMDRYILILETLSNENNINLKLASTSFLLPDEVERYKKWNNTRIDFNAPTLLHECFQKTAKKYPSNIALMYDNTCISYAELDAKTSQLANYLISQGVQVEDFIGIYQHRSLMMIISIIGVLKAGAAYVPIGIDYPQERINAINKDSALRFILAHSTCCSLNTDNLILLDKVKNAIAAMPLVEPAVKIQPSNAAYVIYTSGSTGSPKGVVNEHKGIVNYLNTRQEKFNYQIFDKFLLKTPCTFDVSIWEMFLPLSVGASLFILPPEKHADSQFLTSYIINKQITIIHFVPSMLTYFMREEQAKNCISLRHVYCSGEPLTPTNINLFYNVLNAKLINLYGPTESAIDVSYWVAQQGVSKTYIGKPLSNIKLYILDESLNQLPLGAVGEIHISGVQLARGYLNLKSKTDIFFIDNPFIDDNSRFLYKTGDLARYGNDGLIEILGRKDNQIKIRGFRIELGEIAHVARNLDEIKDVYVGKYDNDKLGAYIALFYVCHDNKCVSQDDINRHLAKFLPKYMLPSFYVVLTEFSLLPNGKLDAKAFPEPLQTRTKKITAIAKNATENKLAAMWKDLLSADEISTEAGFFELGGHSLLAIELLEKIRVKFNVNLRLQQFLNEPTVCGLANAISTMKNNNTIENDIQTLMSSFNNTDISSLNPFPLNQVQQAYWVGRNFDMELGNIGAHFYLELTTNFINYKQYDYAMERLIERHPMLRTVISNEGKQETLVAVSQYCIEYKDISDKSASEISKTLMTYRELLSHKLYDPSQYPLFDIVLLKHAKDSARLIFSFDLLICDAQSIYILLYELSILLKKPDTPLPEIGVSFRDYVVFEQKIKNTKTYNDSKNYWTKRIAQLPQWPVLPLKVMPETIKQPTFKRWASSISNKAWLNLIKRCNASSITPSTLLLTLFSKILSQWSNQSHFTVNLTLFNRLPIHKDINKVVGDFTTLNLLEVNFDKTQTFLANATLIQQQLWHDLEHRYYNGVDVIRQYAQHNNFTTSSAMPIVFTSTLTQSKALNASVIKKLGEVEYSLSQTPQVYLDNQIYEYNGKLHFHWDVVEDLFPDGMIESMFDSYCDLINQCVTTEMFLTKGSNDYFPNQQLALISSINRTEEIYSSNILHDDCINIARRHNKKIAVSAINVELSYGQLLLRASNLKRWLHEQDLLTEELVAVLIPKSWEQIVAVLGINMAHGVYIPIDVAWPLDRIQYILTESKIRLIISAEGFEHPILRVCKSNVFYIREQIAATVDNEKNELTHTESEHLAYVIYTSGTTGKPKGVAITHHGAKNTINDINKRFRVTSDDCVLSISALNFDLSVYDIFGLLAVGGRIVIPEQDSLKDPAHWLAQLHQQKITIWNSVPALLELMVNYAESTNKTLPSSLRLILMSGDWIPLNLPKRLRNLTNCDIEIVSLGGATEASIWSILFPIKDIQPNWKSIPYGKPMANQHFYVMDDKLQLCPIWVSGELYIGGVGLAKCYWQNKEATEKSFIKHPVLKICLYRTGDKGRYLPDGNIEFLGRIDRQVKIRGYRIELEEIEKNLLLHSMVSSAIVEVINDDENEKMLAAYVIVKNADKHATNVLLNYLKQKLPEYMVPDSLTIVEKFPMTDNGKIDVKSLSALNSRVSVNKEPQNVSTTCQQKEISVDRIIRKTLAIDDIDINRSLFEYGVTSVDIIKIANAIEKNYGIRIRFQDFYRNPTITGLNAIILKISKERRGAREDQKIVYDIDEREKIKNSKVWHRKNKNGTYINLLETKGNHYHTINYEKLTPVTQYSQHRISLFSISELLQPFKFHKNSNRCFYPSFGNLYALQMYLYIKGDTVEGVEQGIYYYDSIMHKLLLINNKFELKGEHYPPLVYEPLFKSAAFSLFFVADGELMEKMYGKEASKLSLIESGYLAHLLMMSGCDKQLAFHPVGSFEFDQVREYFQLNNSQYLVHSLIGGLTETNEYNEQWEFGEL